MEGSPHVEARQLITVARRRGESLEAVRSMIGTHTGYRRKVLACFDRLYPCARPASEEQKIEIVRLLTQGWTQKRINKKFAFAVSLSVIRRLSRRSGAATFRPRQGRNGRKLAEDVKESIRAAAREGKQPMQIAREFGISCAWALKYCRAAGYQRRTYRLKWSNEQIAECERALRRGEQWRTAARNRGIGLQTLLARISFRKKAQAKP